MFVWEMLAHRLRADGWHVAQDVQKGQVEPVYVVHLSRGGQSFTASAPTLTEAFGAASKLVRVRAHKPAIPALRGPHLRGGGLAQVQA
jgi:hypothetical protein